MMKYKRLTGQEWSENIDLKQELGYSYIYKRLYELETKIEQGTLIELPCKVGTVLYEIVPKCKSGLSCPYNGGFGTSRCKNGCGAYINETKFTFLSMRELIGKSLFLTREEAEKRLLELQGGK